MSSTKELYERITKENFGINTKDVRKIFIWYDLLGFGLSFQLLFIFSYICNWNYAITIISTIFIILVDSIVKENLDRNPKNYNKLKDELPMVKLWAFPLVFIAIVSTLCLIITNFFI